MKKNKMMRLASCLLVAVMLTTSVISGTFAKYTRSYTSDDSARVARWGFNEQTTFTLEGLFEDAYDKNVQGTDYQEKTDVIAPGTTNSVTFSFKPANNAAPEVAYEFVVEASGNCAPDIESNPNIKWKLNETTYETWQALLDGIEALALNDENTNEYAAGTLPENFGGNSNTITWEWLFDDEVDGAVDYDTGDTALGNKATLDTIDIEITIRATQLD